MKYFLAIGVSIVLLNSHLAIAQRGYIRTDSSVQHVQIVEHKKETSFLEVNYFIKPSTKVIKAFPKDIIEYGFIKGDKYSTINLGGNDSSQLFFAKLLVDEANLKLFLVETKEATRILAKFQDGPLVELQDGTSLSSTLSGMMNYCDQKPKWIDDVKFNVSSLTRAFSLHGKCYDGIFPKVRAGILAGYSFNKLKVNGTAMGGELSPVAGFFVDVPLGLTRVAWSITAQAYYQKSGFHVSEGASSSSKEYVANTSSINVPIAFKYYFGKGKTQKYLSLGPSLSYYLKRDSYMYDVKVSGNVVEEEKTVYDSSNGAQVGAMVGYGLNLEVLKKNLLNFELRYQ